LIEEIEAAMLGLLSPVFEEIVTARPKFESLPGTEDRRDRRLLRTRRRHHARIEGSLPP